MPNRQGPASSCSSLAIVAALLLLHGDELAIEAAILVARGVERAGERVEALGDDGKLLDLRRIEPRRVMAVLEAGACPWRESASGSSTRPSTT